jgi:hypothetical protein
MILTRSPNAIFRSASSTGAGKYKNGVDDAWPLSQ